MIICAAHFLAENKAYIDVTKNEVLIPFQINFKSADVSVTLPDWYIEIIYPIM